jgi:hypothetical protein
MYQDQFNPIRHKTIHMINNKAYYIALDGSTMKTTTRDRTFQTYGTIKIIGFAGYIATGNRAVWTCQDEYGIANVRSDNLIGGYTTSLKNIIRQPRPNSAIDGVFHIGDDTVHCWEARLYVPVNGARVVLLLRNRRGYTKMTQQEAESAMIAYRNLPVRFTKVDLMMDTLEYYLEKFPQRAFQSSRLSRLLDERNKLAA